MSCNGCRVLRKGCSDNCILRHCLQWIDGPEAQGHATLFVAKFFGRAGMLGFVSAVPEAQRPALFHSLLFEACGRTINPVSGAVGLLCTGNWQACQSAVETVLNGGFLYPSSTNRGPIRVPFMQMRKSSSNQLQDGEKLPRVRVGRGFLPSPFASASPFEIKQTARTDFIEENFIGTKRKFDSFDILESNAGFESCRVKAKIDPEQSLVCNDFDDHIELDLTLGGSNGSNKQCESKARSGSPSSSCTCAHS